MDTDGRQVRQWARQALLLLLTCALLTLLMLLVRRYVLTIYSDPQTGERMIVNRLDRTNLQKGDKVVYTQGQTPFAGYVSALPGDTITLDGKQYMIPERCACNGTECGYCRNYLVEWGDNELLVSEQRMLGKAYKLW